MAGLLLSVLTALRLALVPSGVGEWNETGSVLGVAGVLGATGAGLVLAVYGHRNLRPLRSLYGRLRPGRLLAHITVRILGPALVCWGATCAAAYGVTAVLTPAPSAPSAWPLVAATLGVMSTVALGLALGTLCPLTVALPAVVVAGFLAPVVLGSQEPSPLGSFSICTSVSLQPQFAPLDDFFLRQSAFFTVIWSICAVLVALLLRRLIGAAALSGLLALVVAGAWLATGPTDRITDAPPTTAERCTERDGVRVCVMSDHERLLPAVLEAARAVHRSMPSALAPSVYREASLMSAPGSAVLDTAQMAVDPASEVVEATARWRTCPDPDDPEAEVTRSLWLAHRAGLLTEVPELDSLTGVLRQGDPAQLTWWRAGMTGPC